MHMYLAVDINSHFQLHSEFFPLFDGTKTTQTHSYSHLFASATSISLYIFISGVFCSFNFIHYFACVRQYF